MSSVAPSMDEWRNMLQEEDRRRDNATQEEQRARNAVWILAALFLLLWIILVLPMNAGLAIGGATLLTFLLICSFYFQFVSCRKAAWPLTIRNSAVLAVILNMVMCIFLPRTSVDDAPPRFVWLAWTYFGAPMSICSGIALVLGLPIGLSCFGFFRRRDDERRRVDYKWYDAVPYVAVFTCFLSAVGAAVVYSVASGRYADEAILGERSYFELRSTIDSLQGSWCGAKGKYTYELRGWPPRTAEVFWTNSCSGSQYKGARSGGVPVMAHITGFIEIPYNSNLIGGEIVGSITGSIEYPYACGNGKYCYGEKDISEVHSIKVRESSWSRRFLAQHWQTADFCLANGLFCAFWLLIFVHAWWKRRQSVTNARA